ADANHRGARETRVILPWSDWNTRQQLVLAENDVRRNFLRSFHRSFDPDDRLGGYSVLAKKPGDMLRNELVPAHAEGAERRTILAHDIIVDGRTNRDKSSRKSVP